MILVTLARNILRITDIGNVGKEYTKNYVILVTLAKISVMPETCVILVTLVNTLCTAGEMRKTGDVGKDIMYCGRNA